jgi:dipeptidyl aminopeptidase/acylaminoacyl peptidase
MWRLGSRLWVVGCRGGVGGDRASSPENKLMRCCFLAAGIAGLFLAVSPRTAPAQGTRALTPRDVIESDTGLFSSGLALDGKALLYLRVARFSQPPPKLFLADLEGGSERELTRVIDQRARIGSVMWSPSGRRFVAAGTIGPMTMLWAGDRNSPRLEPIKHPPLRTLAEASLNWASEDAVILATIPEETISSIVQAEDRTFRQWEKTKAGREPSRSILDSHAASGRSPRHIGSWTLIGVKDGSAKSVPGNGIISRTLAAPDGRSVAGLYRASSPRVDLTGLLPDVANSLDGLRLEVVTAGRGDLTVHRAEGVVDVQSSTLSWSPDGTKLAFFARSPEGGPKLRAFVFEPRGGTVTEMNTEGLGGPWEPPFAWSTRGTLLTVLTTPTQAGMPPGPFDWWVVQAGGRPRNVTAGLTVERTWPPSSLVAEPAGTLVGVVGGVLWRIDPESGSTTNLSQGPGLRDLQLEWPRDSRAGDKVMVSARRGDRQVFGQYDPGDGGFTEFVRPAPDALLSDFQPSAGALVFSLFSGRESSLWASRSLRDAPRGVAEANAHLRDVKAPALESIHYEVANVGKLHGWLALPPGFVRDHRWPMVVYAYPGNVYSESVKPPLDEFAELLAGRGYVVLLPSMPRPAQSSADRIAAFAAQVMPAVDQAIKLGIADPKRLGLMGHSAGGYAVYGLITQTDRFRAAVASAGTSDLVSNYGQFHVRLVRSDSPLDETHHLSWTESGQLGLGVPFWKDPALYVRNSPVQYVGQVQTPLLMLHGDLDFVAIQQAEEFYTSLARRGQRARFVRYWGEGHLIYWSPANFADYWREVFEWFGELLAEQKN